MIPKLSCAGDISLWGGSIKRWRAPPLNSLPERVLSGGTGGMNCHSSFQAVSTDSQILELCLGCLCYPLTREAWMFGLHRQGPTPHLLTTYVTGETLPTRRRVANPGSYILCWGLWGTMSPKGSQVVTRIQFLELRGLRSPFLCWLSARAPPN